VTSILVLDDTQDARDLLSTVLGYAGYRVLQATTGETALDIARSERPELIITDIVMPGMNGYEFVRELRSDPAVGNTPVIFSTASYAEGETRQLADACGVSHFLVKPCEPETIVRVAGEALGSDHELVMTPVSGEQFDRHLLRALNEKLVQKVKELETVNLEQGQLARERETILNSAGEGIYRVDREGRITYANPAVAKLLDCHVEDLLGRDAHALFHHSRADLTPLPIEDCRIKASLRGEVHHVTDEVFWRPNGTGFPVDYTSAPIREGGQIVGVVCVFSDITEQKGREAELRDQLEWHRRITRAVERDELLVYSQPIVDLQTGRPVHEELLVRMRGTAPKEVLPPAKFLPQAERLGLIQGIDRWMLRQSLKLVSESRAVAVNLSALSINDLELTRDIASALADRPTDPSQLIVEITEKAAAESGDLAGEFAHRLNHLGCRLALDDFGTGFGAMTYLRDFPADFLKIDIEFVRELHTNKPNQRLVKTILEIARQNDQHTIAEGVESEPTAVLLRDLGVDFGQGYLFGRPQPVDVPDLTEPTIP
jgi:PAS domain S-box-containing protein